MGKPTGFIEIQRQKPPARPVDERGTVRLAVIESRIRSIQVEGARFFDEANIRASLPALVVGATPNAGLGQGVFAVNGSLGSGYAQQWNASVQRELAANTVVEVSYLGSMITNVGIPDSNANQLTEAQLALGITLLERVPNPYFGIIPRSSSLGDPTITRAQLLKPFPQYTTVSLYRNNVGTSFYQGVTARLGRRAPGRGDFLQQFGHLAAVPDVQTPQRCIDPCPQGDQLPVRHRTQFLHAHSPTRHNRDGRF